MSLSLSACSDFPRSRDRKCFARNKNNDARDDQQSQSRPPARTGRRTGFDLLRNWMLHLPDKTADVLTVIGRKAKIAPEIAGVV
jgi:hypothetical protein